MNTFYRSLIMTVAVSMAPLTAHAAVDFETVSYGAGVELVSWASGGNDLLIGGPCVLDSNGGCNLLSPRSGDPGVIFSPLPTTVSSAGDLLGPQAGTGGNFADTLSVTPIPATLPLLAAGIAPLFALARRRRA